MCRPTKISYGCNNTNGREMYRLKATAEDLVFTLDLTLAIVLFEYFNIFQYIFMPPTSNDLQFFMIANYIWYLINISQISIKAQFKF